MTPKEAYEARKAERKARKDGTKIDAVRSDVDMEEIIDRAVTSLERIADTLEEILIQMKRA